MRTESCEQCRNPLVIISVTIDGTAREMRSCSTCDRRTWSHAEGAIDLAEVLADLRGDDQLSRAQSS